MTLLTVSRVMVSGIRRDVRFLSRSTLSYHQLAPSTGFKETRGYWKALGEPSSVVAPMVDHSFLAFRLLTQHYGVSMAYTQMLHAETLCNSPKYLNGFNDWVARPPTLIPSNIPSEMRDWLLSPGQTPAASLLSLPPGTWTESPLVVQLAGDEGEVMLRAAHQICESASAFLSADGRFIMSTRGHSIPAPGGGLGMFLKPEQINMDVSSTLPSEPLVEYRPPLIAAVDVNLGCPQHIARRGNYGAWLLQDSVKTLDMVTHLCRSAPLPVSVKIRRLATIEATVDMALRLQEAGASALTIHGRTVSQRKQLTGATDWEAIAAVKSALSIPVIANGGIERHNDIKDILVATGADAVMSSESLLQNPGLFNPTIDEAFHDEKTTANISIRMAKKYLTLATVFGTPDDTRYPRYHLFKLLHRCIQAPANRDLRSRLERCEITDMWDIIHTLEERMSQAKSEPNSLIPVDLAGEQLLSPKSWYWRHRSEGRVACMSKEQSRNVENSRTPESEDERKIRMTLLKQALLAKRSPIRQPEEL